jgi:hypothetical protein
LMRWFIFVVVLKLSFAIQDPDIEGMVNLMLFFLKRSMCVLFEFNFNFVLLGINCQTCLEKLFKDFTTSEKP